MNTVAAATMKRMELYCTHPVSGSLSVGGFALVSAGVAVGTVFTVSPPPVFLTGIIVGVMVR